ncbi:ComEA family DNA-binding protein [Pseudomonas caspiana]|uniref:Competence protein ComEA n=1 Tax=Pseudomonas caspiana TaxID=1451454 RepID=A0A1Y3NXQ2_9PSED|nr:ComEA family DNA-binding protein [Pseudomonas caspiana]OUM72347.1 competence protein ComEA [Pseudomonas caspiana]
MRRAFLSSLVFAFLTSASVAVTAAPITPSEKNTSTAAVVMQDQVAPKVNINTAEAETLQKQLSGIGKGKADAIVAYREANGEFTSVDELIEVKGIGKALLDKNRDRIAVE